MKLKFYTLILFMFSILIFYGCKTASKHYESGNYDEAVELAVKKIQKKKDDAEFKSLLQHAYHYAVQDHEKKIRNYSAGPGELKWEWIYAEYSALQKLSDVINRTPEARELIQPPDYSSYMDTYAEKAAATRLDRGMYWMNRQDKQGYRNAYHEFNAALRYRPEDIEIRNIRDEAYENAVVNVVITPVENSFFRYSSNNNHAMRDLENSLLRSLRSQGNQFSRFLTEWEARSRNIRPDQFIDFRFTSFNIGRTRDENSSREVSKDVVVKETVYRPDSVVREYKKVFARITTTRRSMNSTGTLNIQVRDDRGFRIWSDNFRSGYNWNTEFSTYTGDERALSETDKQLVSKHPDPAPHEEQILQYLVNNLSSEMNQRLRNHFNRY